MSSCSVLPLIAFSTVVRSPNSRSIAKTSGVTVGGSRAITKARIVACAAATRPIYSVIVSTLSAASFAIPTARHLSYIVFMSAIKRFPVSTACFSSSYYR